MASFRSLRAFQEAHRTLLQRYRAEGKVTPELQSEIAALLRSGRETGRLLDTLSDQKAAQALLDYWSTVLPRDDAESGGVLLADFDPSTEPELADEDCPYVGLRGIEEFQSSKFFGREDLVREMLDRLRDGNLLAVVGPLGSGRSSLVYAGLLPALAHGQLPGSESWPVTRLTTPLADQLVDIGQDPTTITVIDNCDDLFAVGSEADQAKFAQEVLCVVDKPGVRRIVVLILHTDYEQMLKRAPSLAERIKAAHVKVTSPSAKDLRDAIERPAQLVGLKFDDDVVDTIVHDIVGERSAFALLQFTMKKLWERRTHNRITFKTLQEVGAGRTAVDQAARAFYEGLSKNRRQLLRPILVRLGSAAPSAASKWHTLVEASTDPSGADDLLKALQRAGLIVVSAREGGENAGESVVRLVHDALKDWDELAEWIKEEKDQIETLSRLEGKAHDWVLSGRNEKRSLNQLEYLEAEKWLDSPAGSRSGASDEVRGLIEASRQKSRREVQFLMRIAAGFGIAAVVIAVLALFAWNQRDEAARQRDEAALHRDEAALQRDRAILQGRLTRLIYIDTEIRQRQKDVDLKLTFFLQLKRSQQKAESENPARALELGRQIAGVEAERGKILDQMAVLADDQNRTISDIIADNSKRWNGLTGGERERIIAKVLQTVTSDTELSLQSRLRVALFAVAAIPQTEQKLNDALRKAILAYRLRNLISPPGSTQVWAVAFRPDGREAAIGDELGQVWQWDPLEESTSTPKNLSAASDIVNGLAYSADGKLLAAAYRTSGAVVFQLEAGGELCPLDRRSPPAAMTKVGEPVAGGGTYGVAFAPDGKTLAVATGRAAQLWDLTKPGCPTLPRVFPHHDEVFSVAFSPDGRLLATASGDGTVAVWKLDQGGGRLGTFPTDRSTNPMLAVSFSPTGKALVASSGANGQGYVWDIETGQQTDLPSRGGNMGQIAFSADGARVVATASANGTAFVSDAVTGKELDKFGGGGQTPMFGAAFSPDSKFLLTGNLDGVARLWDLANYQVTANDREQLIAFGAQRFTNMNLTPRECNKLRALGIPIFAFADRGYEREHDIICPLPFLGPRPSVTN